MVPVTNIMRYAVVDDKLIDDKLNLHGDTGGVQYTPPSLLANANLC